MLMIYSSVDAIIIRIVHDTSTEGSKETAIERFFLEAIQYLEANDLI